MCIIEIVEIIVFFSWFCKMVFFIEIGLYVEIVWILVVGVVVIFVIVIICGYYVVFGKGCLGNGEKDYFIGFVLIKGSWNVSIYF